MGLSLASKRISPVNIIPLDYIEMCWNILYTWVAYIVFTGKSLLWLNSDKTAVLSNFFTGFLRLVQLIGSIGSIFPFGLVIKPLGLEIKLIQIVSSSITFNYQTNRQSIKRLESVEFDWFSLSFVLLTMLGLWYFQAVLVSEIWITVGEMIYLLPIYIVFIDG